MMNTKPMDMSKIDIVQPIPKRACKYFGPTCSYCKHKSPHPSPVHSDWSSEDWDGNKAKAKEQKSLIDFKPPEPNTKKGTDQKTDIGKVTEVDDITLSESDYRTRQTKGGTIRGDRFTSPTTSDSFSNGFNDSRQHHRRH